MPDLTLTEREQAALRAVAGAEPVPGTPLLSCEVLDALARLVPCDDAVVVRADDTGLIEDLTRLGHVPLDDPQVCDGPLVLGVKHVGHMPAAQAALRQRGVMDSLWVGCRNGTQHVVQLDLMRRTRYFSERDIALLSLVTPRLTTRCANAPRPRCRRR